MAQAGESPRRSKVPPVTRTEFDALILDAMPALRRRSSSLVREGDDLMQAALVKALHHWHSYDPDRPIAPWLRAIARRLSCEEIRDSQSEARWLALGLPSIPHDGTCRDPAEIVVDEAFSPAFERAWYCLPPLHRVTLWLCVVAGLTTREAADILGESHKAVESRLVRAKAKFRAHFTGGGEPRLLAVGMWFVRSHQVLHRAGALFGRMGVRVHRLFDILVVAGLAALLLLTGDPA
ncbi:MAG: RNA polymerase sigma factor [Actinomycetota bacterium]